LFAHKFFTTTLSDQSVVELEESGSTRAVTFENRIEYARKALYTRMKECERQCAAIKQGICQIVPEALLNMVGYQELEEWIYGKKLIDVGLLKQNSRLAAGYSEDDPVIKWFWEVVTEFPEAERRKLICFCFAQYTIPRNEEFERRGLRFQIKPTMEGPGSNRRESKADQDLRLPRADTCFFNFELPRYSSKEVMKKKILKALHMDNMSLNAEAEPDAGGAGGGLNSGPGLGARAGDDDDDY